MIPGAYEKASSKPGTLCFVRRPLSQQSHYATTNRVPGTRNRTRPEKPPSLGELRIRRKKTEARNAPRLPLTRRSRFRARQTLAKFGGVPSPSRLPKRGRFAPGYWFLPITTNQQPITAAKPPPNRLISGGIRNRGGRRRGERRGGRGTTLRGGCPHRPRPPQLRGRFLVRR